MSKMTRRGAIASAVAAATARTGGATTTTLPPLRIPASAPVEVQDAMRPLHAGYIEQMAWDLDLARAWYKRFPDLVTARSAPEWGLGESWDSGMDDPEPLRPGYVRDLQAHAEKAVRDRRERERREAEKASAEAADEAAARAAKEAKTPEQLADGAERAAGWLLEMAREYRARHCAV